MKRYPILFLLLLTVAAHAQKGKRENRQLLDHLKHHIAYLADDKLEGRRAGTLGEALAATYISQQFAAAGLSPKGTDGFYQPFEMAEGKQVNSGTHLVVNSQPLTLGTDYFPLVYSPNVHIEAMPAPALQEDGMPWFWDINETIEAGRNNPHFDLEEIIRSKATEIAGKGATSLLLFNSGPVDDELAFDATDGAPVLPIPVLYITKPAHQKYFADESATFDINLAVDLGAKKRTGTNVLGFINNGAPHTVVIGAHFDHLGYGEDGSSLQRTGTPQIHNGADDNASGTAALIELARQVKASRLKNNNYLFAAFSGEEAGLYGSKYFTQNPTVDIATINYMINMDMVGRLNDSSKAVTVGGYGTSPAWAPLFASNKKLYTGPLHFRFDSSGTGPSDHTSFYLKGIPVLFYFTGLHADYHRPTDDWNKINFEGETEVVKHIFSVIEAADRQGGKLPFLKTHDVPMGTTARFSVTLGIMPDYTFTGNGVRADAVSDHRPAQKAGLAAGDVITALGTFAVTSLESYMQALSQYKRGDTTTVSFTHDNQQLQRPLVFE